MAMAANLLSGSGGAYGRVYVISSSATTDTTVSIAPTSATTTPIVPRTWNWTPASVGAGTTATEVLASAVFVTLNASTGVITLQRSGQTLAVTSTDTTVNGIGRLTIWDDMP